MLAFGTITVGTDKPAQIGSNEPFGLLCTVNIGGLSGSSSFDSTGFALEPGAGIEFNIVRHLVIGFSTGFPIAFHHLSQNRSFTAVDIDLLATVGLRL